MDVTASTSFWSIKPEQPLFTSDAMLWHNEDAPCDDMLECPEDVVSTVTQPRSRGILSKGQPSEAALRRRAQNRASQRAYRERKDNLIEELERKLKDKTDENKALRRDIEELKKEQAQWMEGKEELDNNDTKLWRTVLRKEVEDIIDGGLTVNVMVCKRCCGRIE